MAQNHSSRRVRVEDYHVNNDDRPGWVRGSTRVPAVGEPIYCAGGAGEVLSVRGRTGDGSPLVEIQLEDPKAKPFYAAASNVLVAPAA